MQLALYRAERPEVFEDIIGQKQIVKILQNQIKTGTVSQAYLFTGTHGTGKTTTARILAKAVNCMDGEPGSGKDGLPCGHCANCEAIREGKFVDVIELDAASNNGVDDLRAIIDLVKYPPTVGRYKVYIIDEVHMLSQAAENAFLKTLEEPPEYAIFILATTDPEKVRPTIRSRCMQLNFKRVSEEELIAGMQHICEKKGVNATRDALGTIAARADGSVRDALSILEQCMAAGDSTLDKNLVLEYTGAAGEDFFLALTDAVGHGDLGKALLYIDEIIKRGKDAKQLLKDWLEHYRNLMVVKYVAKAERVISASAENIDRLKGQAASIDIKDIEKAIRLISEYINIGRYSDRPRILLETVAVRLAGTDAASGVAATITPAPAVGQNVATVPKRQTAAPAAPVRAQAPQQSQPVKAVPIAREPEPASEPEDIFKTDAPEEDNRAKNLLAQIAAASREDEESPIAQIESAPREEAGDAVDMWNRIVAEIAQADRSFESFVGRHSRGYSYEDGVLEVHVKKNKMDLANNKMSDIVRAAKDLFGQSTRVVIHEGEIDTGRRNTAYFEMMADEVMNEDDMINELASDISNLFGVDVDILDK